LPSSFKAWACAQKSLIKRILQKNNSKAFKNWGKTKPRQPKRDPVIYSKAFKNWGKTKPCASPRCGQVNSKAFKNWGKTKHGGVFRSGRLLLFGRLMIKTVLFIIVPEPRSFARAYQTHNKPILLIIKKHLHVLENIARNPRVN